MYGDISPYPDTHTHTQTHFLAEKDKEVKGLVQGHTEGQGGQVIYTGAESIQPSAF